MYSTNVNAKRIFNRQQPRQWHTKMSERVHIYNAHSTLTHTHALTTGQISQLLNLSRHRIA